MIRRVGERALAEAGEVKAQAESRSGEELIMRACNLVDHVRGTW